MGGRKSEKCGTEPIPILVKDWIIQNPTKANQYDSGSDVDVHEET